MSIFSPSNENAKSDVTWREVLAEWFAERAGPVTLPELYAAFAGHPKAVGNANYAAKLRQQLQRGPYRHLDRGLWSAV